MDEVGFRNWLNQKNKNHKVISDTISRLKRIEKEFDFCNLDDEFKNDGCAKLIQALANNGKNDTMKSYPKCALPIGKYAMGTYRYAVNLYLQFMEEQS